MANLEDLEAFDHHLSLARNDINALTMSRGRDKGVWSDKQERQFGQLHDAVRHLHDAISELVGQNR